MILVDDSGINAGALSPFALQAALSMQEMALRQKLPFVHLVESAGANLMNYQVDDWARGGAVFRNLARLSAAVCRPSPCCTALRRRAAPICRASRIT